MCRYRAPELAAALARAAAEAAERRSGTADHVLAATEEHPDKSETGLSLEDNRR